MVLHLGWWHEHGQRCGLFDRCIGHAVPVASLVTVDFVDVGRCGRFLVHGLEWVFCRRVALDGTTAVGWCGQCGRVHCRWFVGGPFGRSANSTQWTVVGPVLRWHGHWHCAVGLAGAGGVAMGASAAACMGLGVVVFGLGVRLGHVGFGLACKGFGQLGVCQPNTRGIGCRRAHVSATAHGLCFGGLHRFWRGLHRLHDVCHRTLA